MKRPSSGEGATVEAEPDRARRAQTWRRAGIAAFWISGILVFPVVFTFTSDRPILWPHWTRYFFAFALPYSIGVLMWVYPGGKRE